MKPMTVHGQGNEYIRDQGSHSVHLLLFCSPLDDDGNDIFRP